MCATSRSLGWLLLFVWQQAVPAPPLLTGIVEDAESQAVEMPRLPGAWQRRIEWMAPEGSTVSAGDLIVRLDPGTMIVQEEQARTDLEIRRLEADRRSLEMELAIVDAETVVVEKDSDVRLAGIDAGAPVSTTPRLDFERHQLALATAEHALENARSELLARTAERTSNKRALALAIDKAESHWLRMRDAIEKTEIRANRQGLVIYAQNRFTGRKVFPGETLQTNVKVVEVASREGLQFRFWVHEADIGKLRNGVALTVTADALPMLPVRATVDWTSKQATERSKWSLGGYFELTAIPLETVPPGFMPGMAVMAELRP